MVSLKNLSEVSRMTQSDPSGLHDWNSAPYVQEWIDVNGSEDRGPLLRRMMRWS